MDEMFNLSSLSDIVGVLIFIYFVLIPFRAFLKLKIIEKQKNIIQIICIFFSF